MRNVKPRATEAERLLYSSIPPCRPTATLPFSLLLCLTSSHRPDAWFLLRYRYQIIPLRSVHSDLVHWHAVSMFSPCVYVWCLSRDHVHNMVHNTITETSKFTIALRVIFQSLCYLPLAENVYHNFSLPPCATPGSRARHERGQ